MRICTMHGLMCPQGCEAQKLESKPPRTEPILSDFAEFPSAYLKAMLMRLRIELFTCAQALQGELAKEFWQLIEDVASIHPPLAPDCSSKAGEAPGAAPKPEE